MEDAAGPIPRLAGPDADDWDAAPRRIAASNTAPVLSVDGFEGPLDWLVEMARARRIDLERLSIAALVDSFATALSAALAEADRRPLTLARWGDWLVMVADLTLLRSRLLLPDDAGGDARREAEALRGRLLSRVAIGAAADWLEARGQVGRDVFTRGTAEAGRVGGSPRTTDVTGLLRACLAAIRLPPDEGSRYRLPAVPHWSVGNATVRIRAMLPSLGEVGGALSVFLPEVPATAAEPEGWCRSAVASTFLAGLELTRDGSIALVQGDTWAPIHVLPRRDPVLAPV